MYIFENRASLILYNFILSANKKGVYIIPANICPIVVTTFLKAKAKFEFIDISKKDLCIDEDIVIDKISKHPKKYAGILYDHTYGVQTTPSSFFKKIRNKNQKLLIIDDKCLCTPSFEEPKNLVDLTVYSTGYSKIVDLGYGGYGFLSTKYNNIKYIRRGGKYDPRSLQDLNNQFRQSISDKSSFKYSESAWLNYSTPTISPKKYIRSVKIALAKALKNKAKLNLIYSKNLPKRIQLPQKFQSWRFNILVSRKEQLINNIFSTKLFASSHYYPANKLFDKNRCPITEELYKHIINLFNDFHYNPKQALDTCDIINKNLANIT